MDNSLPIHDLFVRQLGIIDDDGVIRMPILSFEDHLLRRFGFAESHLLDPEYRSKLKIRAVADELWACLNGKVLFSWWDLREGSPSYEKRYEVLIEEPTLVLAPFGVAFGIQTFDETVNLLRFATHPEGKYDGDRTIPWEVE